MRKRFLVMLVLGILLSSVVFAAGQGEQEATEQETYVVSVAVHPLEYYRAGPMAMMEYIERESDGRITFETFQFPELGSDTDVVELVSIGEIEMFTAIADSGVAQMMPSAQALSLPFLFPNLEVFVETMDGPFFDDLAERMQTESNGSVRILSAMLSSRRHLYSVDGPIRTPADLADMIPVMRTQTSPLHLALWEALGTSPIGLPAAERYTALQTGMIYATEGGLMSAWQAGLMEVQKYATLTNHVLGTGFIGINEEFFQSLPADLQEIVVDGAWVGAEHDNTNIPKESERALDLMEDADVLITAPTPAESSEWREVALPIGYQFLTEESGLDEEWVQHVLESVEAAEARVRN
jgi:TRAP-type C4-dicarboxylate transport system substrate-binding protein